MTRSRTTAKAGPPREGQIVKAEVYGKRMRIYVNEAARRDGKALFVSIVEELAAAGLAGCSVFRGVSGYSAHEALHSDRSVIGALDLPVMIEVVDTEERIAAFLPGLEAMMPGGLVTLNSVRIA